MALTTIKSANLIRVGQPIKICHGQGVQLLAQWLAPLVLTTWAGVRIPPIAFWRGDLMEGNPRDSSHLRVRKLWVRVVVRPIIAHMCPTSCQNRV